mmetsp:Transcript_69143/g.179693  ORF Transcript_69143/g.179693 Transcript_69143/m.179693 type:complete len:162 (-) Transcript_69143:50-535(-)
MGSSATAGAGARRRPPACGRRSFASLSWRAEREMAPRAAKVMKSPCKKKDRVPRGPAKKANEAWATYVHDTSNFDLGHFRFLEVGCGGDIVVSDENQALERACADIGARPRNTREVFRLKIARAPSHEEDEEWVQGVIMQAKFVGHMPGPEFRALAKKTCG